MIKQEIYNLQNWNQSPQLIIYCCISMFQLELATVAIIRLNCKKKFKFNKFNQMIYVFLKKNRKEYVIAPCHPNVSQSEHTSSSKCACIG